MTDLIKIDQSFSDMAQEEGIKAWAFYYHPQGKMVTKNGVLEGKEAILDALGGLYDLDELFFEWTPLNMSMSDDETLGYTYGSYYRTYRKSDGEMLEERGHYTSLWVKDTEGKWKISLDIGN